MIPKATLVPYSSAWLAIVEHCAKLSEQEQQAADDELYDHVDPHF